MVERAAEAYAIKDRERIEQRTRRWADITHATRTDARLTKLRQQRHRQIENIKPHHDLEVFDPWALAEEGLLVVKNARLLHEDAQELSEILRRLAWGPDDRSVLIMHTRPRHRRQIPGQLSLWPEALEAVA